MFHQIPGEVLACMRELEQMDSIERRGAMAHFDRLRQIPSGTGRFLEVIAQTLGLKLEEPVKLTVKGASPMVKSELIVTPQLRACSRSIIPHP